MVGELWIRGGIWVWQEFVELIKTKLRKNAEAFAEIHLLGKDFFAKIVKLKDDSLPEAERKSAMSLNKKGLSSQFRSQLNCKLRLLGSVSVSESI